MTRRGFGPGAGAPTRTFFEARAILVVGVIALGLFLPTPSARADPLDAVVGVHATIPENARTAGVLGTERAGSGVVIGKDGLVVTIGYLIMEAMAAEIMLPGGSVVPAEIVAYDYDSGFGLLRALQPVSIDPIELGDSANLKTNNEVLVAGFGGPRPVIGATVVSRRDFAGYWEYLLPDAIFTAPPHHSFGGAALIGPDGRLLGIGSLIVGDAAEPDTPLPGNMFVPIDALKPIFDDLLRIGRSSAPARPWLGIYTEDQRGHVIVNRVAPEGPAAKAGLARDDIIVAVKGQPVHSVAEFYRKLWALGRAGTRVPLTVLSSRGMAEITVDSGDRYDYLKLKPSY